MALPEMSKDVFMHARSDRKPESIMQNLTQNYKLFVNQKELWVVLPI